MRWWPANAGAWAALLVARKARRRSGRRLRHLQPSGDEQRITAYLTAPERSVARRFWTDLASMDDATTRLGYAWMHLFPSAAYMRARYHVRHAMLLPLYYPYRWLRGLRGERRHLR